MSERRTDATESGSSRDDWVTPTAAIATGGQTSRSGARKGELLLSGQAQQTWVTPQARDGEQRGVQSMRERVAQGHSMSLPEQVKDWPTATALEYGSNRGGSAGRVGPIRLSLPAPESRSTSGRSRARLNHRWVAQLMGYPSDWLDGIDEQP